MEQVENRASGIKGKGYKSIKQRQRKKTKKVGTTHARPLGHHRETKP
jgi:hypothetical protein